MAFTSKNATNWEMETISTEMQPWIIQGGGSDIAQKVVNNGEVMIEPQGRLSCGSSTSGSPFFQ
jgi:Fe-S cluster biogenesis protein NfuA